MFFNKVSYNKPPDRLNINDILFNFDEKKNINLKEREELFNKRPIQQVSDEYKLSMLRNLYQYSSYHASTIAPISVFQNLERKIKVKTRSKKKNSSVTPPFDVNKLSAAIIRAIVEPLVYDQSETTEWKLYGLAMVSKEFFDIVSDVISNNPCRHVEIKSSLNFIGSKFCIFKSTPLHLCDFEFKFIPKERQLECQKRLKWLTQTIIIKLKSGPEGESLLINILNCKNLVKIFFVETSNNLYHGKRMLKIWNTRESQANQMNIPPTVNTFNNMSNTPIETTTTTISNRIIPNGASIETTTTTIITKTTVVANDKEQASESSTDSIEYPYLKTISFPYILQLVKSNPKLKQLHYHSYLQDHLTSEQVNEISNINKDIEFRLSAHLMKVHDSLIEVIEDVPSKTVTLRQLMHMMVSRSDCRTSRVLSDQTEHIIFQFGNLGELIRIIKDFVGWFFVQPEKLNLKSVEFTCTNTRVNLNGYMTGEMIEDIRSIFRVMNEHPILKKVEYFKVNWELSTNIKIPLLSENYCVANKIVFKNLKPNYNYEKFSKNK